MFTTLVTAATIFMGIGLTKTMITDKTGEKVAVVKEIAKDSVKWPKELYDKMKKEFDI